MRALSDGFQSAGWRILAYLAGGVSTQQALTFGTPEEVRREVGACLVRMVAGGRRLHHGSGQGDNAKRAIVYLQLDHYSSGR